MELLTLKRIDDGRLLTVQPAEPSSPTPALETSPYDAGYRRIIAERELPSGRARIFESGGSFVLIVHQADRVRAFDAQSLMQAERTPHLLRSQQFSIEAGASATDPLRLAPLGAVVDEGWIWVNIEADTLR
jgi:hypothetical protein